MDRWFDTGSVSLRYRLQGQGARTMVCVHEAGGCLESWDDVASALGREARVLSYDQRGAGLSEKPTAPLTLDALVGDLRALIGGVVPQASLTLVGCAVGAAVAIRYAARHPAQVAQLLLISPATGIAPTERAAALALAGRIERDGMRARVDERFDRSYATDFFTGRDDRATVRARLLHADPTRYAQYYRMLCALDMTVDLAALTTPTRVVAGRRDGTRPPAQVEQVARAIRGAHFEVIDSGHASPILTPALVVAQVRAHWRNQEPILSEESSA